jgi:hypothetical protein
MGEPGKKARKRESLVPKDGPGMVDQYDLRDYVRLLTDARGTFNCCRCNRSFSERRRLTKHEGAHRDPVSCPLCDKHFPTKAKLWKHKKIHEQKEKFMCPETGCESQLGRKAELDRHIKSVSHLPKQILHSLIRDNRHILTAAPRCTLAGSAQGVPLSERM